jgi:hypothetical protein
MHMHDQPNAARGPLHGVRTAVVVAVTGSALAGLIHAAAAKEHNGDRTLFWMFVLCAIAQLAWAATVAKWTTRRVLLTGIVINGGAVFVWFLSRTTGIPFVDALQHREAVGSQDLAGALYAGASVAAAGVILARPVARRTLPPLWSVSAGAAALLLAMPVIAAGHTHDTAGHVHVVAGADHTHDGTGVAAAAHGHDSTSTDATHDASAHDGATHDAADHDAAAHDGATHDDTSGDHGHGTTDAAAGSAGHGHDSSSADSSAHSHDAAPTEGTSGDGHVHADPPPGEPTVSDPGHEHPSTTPSTTPAQPTGPIISVDDPRLTPAQQAAARDLIARSRDGMQAFPTVTAVEQAGYASIGDGGTDGYEHYVNFSSLSDPYEVDPNHIESIVVKKNGDGTKTVVSAMYILSLGKTMADVPDIAGDLTTWHDHTNLCWDGLKVVGTTVNGVCARGVLILTPPMLHVWMVDNPCGPFAGIDEHGGACVIHDH